METDGTHTFILVFILPGTILVDAFCSVDANDSYMEDFRSTDRTWIHADRPHEDAKICQEPLTRLSSCIL